MRSGVAALLLLGASVGLAGCGSSSGGGSAATPVSVQTATDGPTTPPAEPAPPEAESPPTTEAPPTTEVPPSESASPPPAEEPRARPLPGLPRFTAGYEDWLRLNEDPIPPREGGDAHLSTKNIYASKAATRSSRSLAYPVGTVIVKEGVRPGTDFIGLIATMRKAKGADPEHGDWIFVEWARNRRGAPFEELARDATCWGCHSEAAATDYVWVHTLGEP